MPQEADPLGRGGGRFEIELVDEVWCRVRTDGQTPVLRRAANDIVLRLLERERHSRSQPFLNLW
jgi:hypothetical protein